MNSFLNVTAMPVSSAHWRAAFALSVGLLAAVIVRFTPETADFPVFYAAAAHPEIAYDVHALSQAIGLPRLEAFGYPPPFLWLIRPLALFPLRDAWSLWSGLTSALFAFLAVNKLGWKFGALCVAASPVYWAAITGQLTLLIAALVMLGAYGPAALLKPTTLILSPLLGRKVWPQIALGAVLLATGLAIGWGDWLRWAHSLGDYMAADNAAFLTARKLAPFPLWAHLLLGAVAAGLALRTSDPDKRMVAIIVGSLLLSPHAYPYDLAVAAPFILSGRSWPPIWLAFVGGAFSAAPMLSPLLLAAAV